MSAHKVRINARPGADKYASAHQRIVEFSAGHEGAGGLISFTLMVDGTIDVHVYRQEKTTVTFSRLNRAQRFAAQVAHITEHEALFRSVTGADDVAAYFESTKRCMYGGDWDLYQRLCARMQIEPKPENCHPNPED